MIETNLNHMEVKPPARCVECDRETDHYITFISPTNEQQNICWECYDRSEKGFNTKREWRRTARQKQIEEVTNQGTPDPPFGAQH